MLLQRPLLATLWAAAILFAVRVVAVFMGSWMGAFVGGTPPELRRKIWQGMITQVTQTLHVNHVLSARLSSQLYMAVAGH